MTVTTDPPPAFAFDPATGVLSGPGVDLMSVPELIGRAREAGYRFLPRNYWKARGRCGCALGLQAKLRDADYDGGSAMDALGLFGDDRVSIVGADVMIGFDTGRVEGYSAGALYGRAVREAAVVAGLWAE